MTKIYRILLSQSVTVNIAGANSSVDVEAKKFERNKVQMLMHDNGSVWIKFLDNAGIAHGVIIPPSGYTSAGFDPELDWPEDKKKK